MRITIHRQRTNLLVGWQQGPGQPLELPEGVSPEEEGVMLVAAQSEIFAMPGRVAVVTYDTGWCVLVQAEYWDQFVILKGVGIQYTREQLIDMFAEIAEAEAGDDEIVVLHRDPPVYIPE